MIDLTAEQLIPIRDVPKRLPPRTSGKRLHISAVYRWIQRGVRGVRLESIKLGGTTYTTVEALQRFSNNLSSGVDMTVQSQPTARARQRQIDRASQEVDSILRPSRESIKHKKHQK